jgi:squalene-associated FAD-dependent desaturase
MIYVIGGGLAGLSCAVALIDAGAKVTLLEAGPAAGGRCRSYDDRELGCRIDNGNHLLLSGNAAAYRYLTRLGTANTLGGPGAPVFPFMDLQTGERWVLRPGMGRLPFWVFDASRRVLGTNVRDYLSLAAWLRVPDEATVAQVARPGALYRRLIEPLAIAALNTLPDIGDAALMAAVVRQTLLRGGRSCIPAFPRIGLSESFVDPALALLRRAGALVRLNCRANGLTVANGRVHAIGTTDGAIDLDQADQVAMAVPAPVAASLLPQLTVPDAFESILNVHYRADADPGAAGFYGLIGGLSEWVFIKPGIVSVTISAANRFAELPPDEAAQRVWAEVARACGLPGERPQFRVVREKRATFTATPAQNRRRPTVGATGLSNLALAGDWTATGLPATIEGAIQSGMRAATHLRATLKA